MAGQLLAASAAARAPLWLVAATGLVGATIAAGAWILTGAAVTIAHEGGHAIWFPLTGGIRSVLDPSALRATGEDTISDAYTLGRMTSAPAAIWVGLFTLVGFGALVAGGLIMAGALGPAA